MLPVCGPCGNLAPKARGPKSQEFKEALKIKGKVWKPWPLSVNLAPKARDPTSEQFNSVFNWNASGFGIVVRKLPGPPLSFSHSYATTR